MKKTLKVLSLAVLLTMILASCKKSNTTKKGTSPMAGFWTFKSDPSNPDNYWNANALFLSNGTFRMYTALSLADTSAAQAIADTANQVVTFGTYTISGTSLNMSLTEFGSIGISCSGSVNSTYTTFDGNLEVTSDPNSASPLWILTKP